MIKKKSKNLVIKVPDVGQDSEPGGARVTVMLVKYGQIVVAEPSLVPRAKNSSTGWGDAYGNHCVDAAYGAYSGGPGPVVYPFFDAVVGSSSTAVDALKPGRVVLEDALVGGSELEVAIDRLK